MRCSPALALFVRRIAVPEDPDVVALGRVKLHTQTTNSVISLVGCELAPCFPCAGGACVGSERRGVLPATTGSAAGDVV